MNEAIETSDLGKHYREVKAVEHLSLQVAEGEIYAFLGLNGAGKTTTIRMLLGMIRPTSGYAMVLGTKVRMGATKPWASVGYMVEDPHAYQELSVLENLEATRRLHPGTPPSAVSVVIERLGLTAYAERRTGTLSHGNAQRLGIAKALLHSPSLLILDEPANGLDPAGIVEIRQLMLELIAEGRTVFMSSHILAEVARLASRIGIIHHGTLLQELTAAQLEGNRQRKLIVRVHDPGSALQTLTSKGIPAESAPDGSLVIRSTTALEHPEAVSQLLVQAGTPPYHLAVDEEELEQYFLRLVGMSGLGQNE